MRSRIRGQTATQDTILYRFRPPIWCNTLRPMLCLLVFDCMRGELIIWRGSLPALYSPGGRVTDRQGYPLADKKDLCTRKQIQEPYPTTTESSIWLQLGSLRPTSPRASSCWAELSLLLGRALLSLSPITQLKVSGGHSPIASP